MQINKVTITGADNKTNPFDLMPLTREFPYVRASLSIPSSAIMRETPPAVIKAVVNTFGRRGLKEIWEFRDNSAPQLVWNS